MLFTMTIIITLAVLALLIGLAGLAAYALRDPEIKAESRAINEALRRDDDA